MLGFWTKSAMLVARRRRWSTMARRPRPIHDVIVVHGRIGLEDRIGLEVVAHHEHRSRGIRQIDDQRGVDAVLPPSSRPLAETVAGVGNGSGAGRWSGGVGGRILQFAVQVVAGRHRMRIRRAVAIGPGLHRGGNETPAAPVSFCGTCQSVGICASASAANCSMVGIMSYPGVRSEDWRRGLAGQWRRHHA